MSSQFPGREPEVIVPMPDVVPPARHVRSTILIASIAKLREIGRFDDYLASLPKEQHELLLQATPGEWLPVHVALAHYKACDALALTSEETIALGTGTLERVGATIVGTTMRMAKQSGATPFTLFPHFPRFWTRGYDGGAVAVYKLAPKDVRIDVVEFALCESAFYRGALRGWVAAMVGWFCTRAYVHERRGQRGEHSVSYRVQWA